MGVDPTKFGKKSMSVFIGLYYFEYKTIGLLPAAYNVCHCQRHVNLTNYLGLNNKLMHKACFIFSNSVKDKHSNSTNRLDY